METDIDCPICLHPMTETDKVATLLPCGHRFHTQCIRDALVSTRELCPVCKRTVTNVKPQQQTQLQQQQLQRDIAELLAAIEAHDAQVERALRRPTSAYMNDVLERLSNSNRSRWW